MATKTKKETNDNGHSRSRKLSLCFHLASLFPFISSNNNSPNGNDISPSSCSRTSSKLTLFFDTIVLKYRLYASSCESNAATTPSILTLIDPDEKYFEPFGTQPENEKTTVHLGQDLDIKYLTMKNFIYLLPLVVDSKQSKTDSIHTQQQDLDTLTKTLLFLQEQYHTTTSQEDLGMILQTWQHQVLEGVTCTFSGVIPQQDTPETSRFWQLATMYGAHCCLELTGKVTHLVASRTGTTKVNKAQHYPTIHVVTVRWLLTTIALSERQDEGLYPVISSVPASTVVTPVTTPLGNEDDLEEDSQSSTIIITSSQQQQQSLLTTDQEEEVHDINHIDWDEADREVNDYMNESGTDDNYSSGPDSPVPDTPISRKRKAASSPLALRRAKTAERGPSRLSTMMVNPNASTENNDQGEDEDEDSSSSLSSFAGELDDEID